MKMLASELCLATQQQQQQQQKHWEHNAKTWRMRFKILRRFQVPGAPAPRGTQVKELTGKKRKSVENAKVLLLSEIRIKA